MHFQILGPLEVRRDGGLVPLGGPKQRMVLAHLLIRPNQLVSADLLIDEIWGDDPPEAARPSLQSYVSHLRKALGPGRLEGRPPGYVLHADPSEIDAWQFESLVVQARRRMEADPAGASKLINEALALWQGEPLADLANELSLQPEIERLTELRLGALEDRAEAELSLGRHAELVPELERLARGHPLRERLHRQLMLALYRTGRQADALSAYHRLRRELGVELGLDPSEAVEDLQRRILSHDPSLEPRGRALRGYRLLEAIGSGPLGTVHRAYEPQTEREVAIKVLAAKVANDGRFVRHFDALAQRVARLEHPHVVALIDWWREPDSAHLVLRLMRGGNLAERLAAGTIEPADGVRWAEQIGLALMAAHRQGLVHGDIRPANVLFDTDDNAYLTDFAVGFDPALDSNGQRNGRGLRYLAHERQQGEPPSEAADVYALAVVLDDLLSGALAGAAAAHLRQVLARAKSDSPAARQSSADLIAAIRSIPSSTEHASAGQHPRLPGPPRNPYKGLRAFDEADVHDFFGREALVGELADRLALSGASSRLLAVVGPSGSGKSSVVHAGLVPALRGGAVAGSESWLIASMTPGERPLENLERALLGVAVDATGSLASLLAVGDGLSRAARRALPRDAQLLLVVDQFEELFTASDAATREHFMDILAEGASEHEGPVCVVITLRADFYDRPLRHERFGRLLAGGTQAVPPLTPEELQAAISLPAEQAGLQLEPGLLARLVAEMSEQPGGLPLLQYALTELWERRDGSRLSLRAYDGSGGLAGAVSRRADELVRHLDAERREAARQLFLRLVELGEGTPDTARRVRLSELRALGRERIDAVIESFARYRLLLFDRDSQTREPTVELAHEHLLRAWPRLQQWVDEARDDLRNQRRLSQSAVLWIESGRDASFLLAGGRLQQTEQWVASTRVLLAPAESEYVAASFAERTRLRHGEEARRAHEASLEQRAVTRLRAFVVALGLGAFLAGALSFVAFNESQRAAREARAATARELAGAAVANLEVDPERSILLAIEAINTTRKVDGDVLPEAEQALHSATVASRALLTVRDEGGYLAWENHPELGGIFVTQGVEESGVVNVRSATTGEVLRSLRANDVDVNDVALSRDGSLVATAGDDGRLRVWLVTTGAEVAALGAVQDGAVNGPSFSPDGSFVAAAWQDQGRVRVLEVASGRSVLEIDELAEPWRTAFSPDGSRLAIADLAHDVARIVDSATGTEDIALAGHEAGLNDVAWSPDGRLLATGSGDDTARIWDAQTGVLRSTIFGHADTVWDVDWSPDSERLITAGLDGVAKLWEITEAGHRELLTLSSQDLRGGVGGAAFSPNGEQAITAQFTDQAVKIWDISPAGNGQLLVLPAEPGTLAGLAFTPDGESLLTSSGDGRITVWNLDTGQPRMVADHHEGWVFSLDVASDGATVASVAQDGLAVWDAVDGDEQFSIDIDESEWANWQNWMQSVDWSPSGEALAVATTTGSAQLVGTDFQVIAELPEGPGVAVWAARFSPDGRLLATAVKQAQGERYDPALHRVTLWDWRSRTQVRTLPASSLGLAFDPTGSLLVTSNVDEGFAEIWEVPSGEKRATLIGHSGTVGDAAWSPAGERDLIATASNDSTVRVWDATTAATRLVLRGHEGPVWQVRFSPDGSSLASAGQDGTVRVWTLDVDELIAVARQKLTRELTPEECREYLHLATCP